MQIKDIEITVFDTETTGLEPETGDRVVEIAAIKLKAAKPIAEFQALVNPGREISAAAFNVNKITPEMLATAPQIQQIMPDFLKFIQGSCICSYNAGFDLRFMNNELKILGLAALDDFVVVDILKMARRLMPGLERYALWFVAEKLGIKTKQEHRAMSDVGMTVDILGRFMLMLEQKGITDYHNFCGLFSLSSHYQQAIDQKVAEIQQAMDLKTKIKIKYLSNSGQVTERQVLPIKIIQENNHFYLQGMCDLKKQERNFRIDGILHMEII